MGTQDCIAGQISFGSVSARSASQVIDDDQASYCQRRPNPVMHGPRPHPQLALSTSTCLLDRSIYSAEIFRVRGSTYIYSQRRRRHAVASSQRRPAPNGWIESALFWHKIILLYYLQGIFYISPNMHQARFFLHLLSSNDFGAVHVIFYDLLVDSRVWA